MNDVQYPCGKCKREVGDEDRAVQCESGCEGWFHAQCVNISEADYDALQESDGIWECSACSNGLPMFNTVNTIDVFNFDFQQNLPTPKLTVGDQFYLRLLWTYLFGVYSASTRVTTAFMWHELLAKRGCNDVISCLAHFIYHTPLGRTGAKWSIWWADNCPGQNKNNYIIWFFQELIRRNVFTRIDYKFLVVGHTYGPTDRCFGSIERYVEKIDTVYTPSQWYQHVQNASVNGMIEVVPMEQSFFRDYRTHFRKLYTERTSDIDKKPLDFSHIVWFNFGKGEVDCNGKVELQDHRDEVWTRHTYNIKEKPQRVSYLKKRGKKPGIEAEVPLLYCQYPNPIKQAKANDLRKLVSQYVPQEYRSFYSELPFYDGDSSDEES